MIKIMIGVIFCLMFVLVYASDEKTGKAVFESRCSICHVIDVVLEKNKNMNDWRATVQRMRKKTASNVISQEDAEIIIQYLSKIRGR